jgi:threonine synthase
MRDFLKNGVYACPEASATLAALNKLENEGAIGKDESVLLYLTGSAMKYFDFIEIKKDKIPLLTKEANSLPNLVYCYY